MGYTQDPEKTAILDVAPDARLTEPQPSRSKRVVACVGVALAIVGAFVAFQAATTADHAVARVETVQPMTLASVQVAQPAPPANLQNPVLMSGEDVMIICAQDSKCIDDGDATSPGTKEFHLFQCQSDNRNQHFMYNATTKMIKSARKANLCWDSGDAVCLRECTGNINTQFVYDWATRAFKNPNRPNMCVDASNFKLQPCNQNRLSQQFDIVPRTYW